MMKKVYLLLSIFVISLFTYNLVNRNSTRENTLKKNSLPKMFSQKKSYVKGKIKKDSPNLFAEYYSMIKSNIGSRISTYPDNYQVIESQKASKYLSLSKKNNLDWVSRGPGNVGGRVRGIIIDPDDKSANTWFVAAVGGGVWKTTNAGSTWQSLTSGMTNLSASYMAMDPSNHDVIYVGTGEGFGNLDALGAQGIWKTENKGGSWQQLSYTANQTFGVINRIIIDPNDSNVLLAATSPSNNAPSSYRSNVWRSTDGGEKWGSVYASDSRIQQIIYEPGNFNIQYATVNGVGVIKSVDAGKTWNDSSSGLVAGGRIELAISSKDTKRLYASVAGDKSDVYVSSDSGTSWKRCFSTEDFLGGQGWYDNAIIVDPFDENVFYVAGVNIYKVTYKGGNKIDVVKLTDNYGSDPALHKGTHVDNHFFAVAKLDDSSYRLVGSNDGGVCYTDNKGVSFKQPNSGFITTQFYGVDKANGKDRYIGGMQDNSCYLSPVDPTSANNWSFVFGGDGFDVVWNYDDENKVMLSSQFNNIAITHSGIETLNQTGWLADVDKGRGLAPFVTKLSQSKQYPDLVFTHGKSGIWRTDDFGITWDNISMPDGFLGGESVSEVKISLADPSVVWAGTSLHPSSSMSISTDYGLTFKEVSKVENVTSYLSGFATHPTEKGTAYALFSAAKKAKVYRTVDFGKTWVDISGFRLLSSNNGFPDVAVFDLLVMPYNTDIIWVGTEIGLFESIDNGVSWHYANNGLPPVSVYDLLIVNDEVVVGTHGRGVWTVSLPELKGYEPPAVTLPTSIEASYLFKDSKQYADINLSYKGDYDNVEVYVNDVLVKEYKDVVEGGTEVLESLIKQGDNVVKVVSSIGTDSYISATEIEGLPLKSNSASYSNNFDLTNAISDDFHGEGFAISKPDNFDSKAINSAHDYVEDEDLLLYLRTPIIVNAEHPQFSYKDVALVEPGEEGTIYPHDEFWDFVTIEGSVDGQNWVKMVAPYDARFDSKWLSKYNSITPSKSDYVDHNFKTTDYFKDGDVVLVRFRLYSDANTVGWGWIIDDLEIQKGALSLEDNYISTQFKVYPNPVEDELHVEAVSDSRIKNVKIYNLSGQLLKNLDFSSTEKADLNLQNFTKGQYLLKVETENGVFSKKVLVK